MNTRLEGKLSLQNTMFFLFCFLILAIPFNTRKIYYSQYTFFSGYLNEFLSYSLYLTDFIVAIMIVACSYISRKNIFQLIRRDSKLKINSLMVIFLAWISISAVANTEYSDISIYYIVRLIECIAVAFMIKYVINTKKRLYVSLLAISVAGTIQGIIAIFQFIFQSSIFGTGLLHKISGESVIAADIIGTSNIIFHGDKIIRAYGTFPHPNILSGFLLITVLISIYIYSIREEILRNIEEYRNTKQGKSQGLLFSWLIQMSVLIQLIGLVVTFSRSAIIAIMIVAFINIFIFKIVSRETIYSYIKKDRSRFSFSEIVKHVIVMGVFLFVILFPAIIFMQRMQEEFIGHQSLQDRIILQNVSRETILANPIFGVGIGSYILNLRDVYSCHIKNYWQYQPDHNVYMLIATEIGLMGITIYMVIFFLMYSNISKSLTKSDQNCYSMNYAILLISIMIAIFILGLFDHYFWTSSQMRLFEWIIFGLIIAHSQSRNADLRQNTQ